MTPRLRPATRKDIEAFYGTVKWTFRAIVAELNGEVIGIGGVYYDGNKTVAFSSIKPELLRYKVTLVRGLKKIMDIVGPRECIAIADPKIETAPQLLRRLGFEEIGGGYFRWARKL